MTAGRWLAAVVRTTRPRQWPKNLVVFAAPLAGATVGRSDGFGYAVLAAVAFGCASAAVYLVNDVIDAERDRRHPVKRHRPIASGALPGTHAVALAVLAACCAIAIGVAIGEPLLVAAAAGYLCSSFLYSARLKHVPFVEMALVASGFLLRVLGGAAATHVPACPSGSCSCAASGRLVVAVAKRVHGTDQPGRPTPHGTGRSCAGTAALAPPRAGRDRRSDAGDVPDVGVRRAPAGTRAWHVASAVPLGLALARFGVLTARRTVRQVEDMITGDGPMLACEVAWLSLFCAGLYTGG